MNTTYFLNLVSGNVFGSKKTPAVPEKYYLGLSSAAPALDGSGVVEPGDGTGYARVELTSLSAPVNGVVTNNAAIDFAESTSEWGTMTHFVVYDALTGGNLLMYGELSASRRVEAATIMTIKLGSLNLSVVNPSALGAIGYVGVRYFPETAFD